MAKGLYVLWKNNRMINNVLRLNEKTLNFLFKVYKGKINLNSKNRQVRIYCNIILVEPSIFTTHYNNVKFLMQIETN